MKNEKERRAYIAPEILNYEVEEENYFMAASASGDHNQAEDDEVFSAKKNNSYEWEEE